MTVGLLFLVALIGWLLVGRWVLRIIGIVERLPLVGVGIVVVVALHGD
jgi:hypothetical protein